MNSRAVFGFDGLVLDARFRYQGIHQYAQALLSEFVMMESESRDIEWIVFGPDPSSANGSGRIPAIQIPGLPAVRNKHLWRWGGLAAEAVSRKLDVLFSPHAQCANFVRARVAIALHDTTYLHTPSLGRLTNAYTRALHVASARTASLIFANSECTRRDILEAYSVSPDRVRTVYHAYRSDIFDAAPLDLNQRNAVLEKYRLDRPYMIHHGTLQPRKNLLRLIEAYGQVMESRPDWDFLLVLVGSVGWNSNEILAAAARPALRGKIVITGPVPAEDLAVLLKSATLCVIPSLYEGFCVPLTEAMACGTPVVCSSTSCFPEVSKGELVYFDPQNTEAIADTMIRALEDQTLLRRLRQAGPGIANTYSWSRCARETVNALMDLC